MTWYNETMESRAVVDADWWEDMQLATHPKFIYAMTRLVEAIGRNPIDWSKIKQWELPKPKDNDNSSPA